MKPILHTIFVLFFFLFTISAQASCVLYKDRYGYEVMGHVQDGLFYDGLYGHTVLGHFDGDLLYKDRYGYNTILGHRDGDLFLNDRYGYTVLGHFDGCNIADFKN